MAKIVLYSLFDNNTRRKMDMNAYLQTLTAMQGKDTFAIYRKTLDKLEIIDLNDMQFNNDDDTFVVMLQSSARILEKAVAEENEEQLDVLEYDIDHLLCRKDAIIRLRPSLPMGFHNASEAYELMDAETFDWCSYRSAVVLLLLGI